MFLLKHDIQIETLFINTCINLKIQSYVFIDLIYIKNKHFEIVKIPYYIKNEK